MKKFLIKLPLPDTQDKGIKGSKGVSLRDLLQVLPQI